MFFIDKNKEKDNIFKYENFLSGYGLNSDIIVHMPFLSNLASKVSFIIELGTYKGEGSTVALVHGLSSSSEPNKIMFSIDKEDRVSIVPQVNYWHFIKGNSMNIEIVEAIKKDTCNKELDILYIDTTHSYLQLKAELGIWDFIISKETILLFHDIWMAGNYNSMTRAILEYAALKDWVFEIITKESCGLGALYHPDNLIMKSILSEKIEPNLPWRFK